MPPVTGRDKPWALFHLLPHHIWPKLASFILKFCRRKSYYMASSVSRQDESNPALWLATRAGKMELSCLLWTSRRVPQEKFPQKPYNKSFIDQACSVKMTGYWPRSFFASLWTLTPSRSINTQKKNLANVQPSCPHTWSITHTYFQWLPDKSDRLNGAWNIQENAQTFGWKTQSKISCDYMWLLQMKSLKT